MNLQCLPEVPSFVRAHHLLNIRSHQVGGHADDPASADGENRQGQAIVAAVDLKGLWSFAADLRGLIQAAAGFLHCDDIAHLGESGNRLRRAVDAGPPGDVVQHARPAGGFGNGHEVRVQTVLRGAVIVGVDEEERVGASPPCLFGEMDRMPGVVGARAGHHDCPTGHSLLYRPHQPDLLVVSQRRRLSSGARDDNPV